MGTIGCDDITALFVSEFIKAQNAIGLTPAFLAAALKRLIKAKKTDTFKGTAESYNEDGQLIRNEVVIYSKPLDDHHTRLKALTMALNIRGVQTTSPQQTTMTLRNDPDAPVIWEGVDLGYLARGIKDKLNEPTGD